MLSVDGIEADFVDAVGRLSVALRVCACTWHPARYLVEEESMISN